jgi:acetyl esterase/lipase
MMIPSIMNDPPDPAEARLPYGDHPSQFVDFRRAAISGTRPLVVMIHGGFWRARRDLTYASYLCMALSAAGFATANIEYRRIGEGGGAWPGTFEDVRRATEFARANAHKFDADTARTVVLGHSAGGHLAVWLSAEIPDLRGAVSLGGVVNLKRAWELHLSNDAVLELMGGTPQEVPERYLAGDPAVRPAGVPRVLIHGSADDVVPVELSRTFPLPHRLLEIPAANHYDVVDPGSFAWPYVVREIEGLS